MVKVHVSSTKSQYVTQLKLMKLMLYGDQAKIFLGFIVQEFSILDLRVNNHQYTISAVQRVIFSFA